jgi:hypothetical protein
LTDVSEVLIASILTLMMEAARTSETLVNFYQTTRRNNPQDSHIRIEFSFISRLYKPYFAWNSKRASIDILKNDFPYETLVNKIQSIHFLFE